MNIKILLFNLILVFLTLNGTAQSTSDTLEINEADSIFEFDQVSKMAVFTGGEMAMYKFIGKNLSYPLNAFENDIQGKVIVEFVPL